MKEMKTIINSALILILTAITVRNTYTDELRFDYDYCVFRYDNQKLFLELYYSFNQQQLTFIKTESGYEADGEIDINVYNQNAGKSVIQKRYKVPVMVNDTLGYNKTSNLTGQVNFLLDSGNYVFKIKACDFNNQSDSAVFEDNLDINSFPVSSVSLSSIQVSSNIKKSADKNNVFYKNTLEIIPNPDRLFGNNFSTLYYYYEIYNLKKENISDEYYIVGEITDLNNNKLKSEVKKYQLKSESKVEFGSFDISDLPTNSYNLVINVIDDKNKTLAQNSKKFFVYNSDTSKINYEKYMGNYLLSEYANYTEEQLDNEFSKAKYIASEAEKSQYEKLRDVDAKRKFIYDFWKRRDIIPGTPKNEFKMEYFERIAYANAHFRYNFKEGWLTDRGRVYVTYGVPDDVERHPFEAEQRAYEIWKYDSIEGGVEFVFVDMSNAMNDYGLVHSTARNELRDDNWKSRLRIK
jgi:GWxTD domain-containing protein